MHSTVTAASVAPVTVPPAARAGTKDVVFVQPSPKATMSASERVPERPESQPVHSDTPLRLRGGCLPCPVGTNHLSHSAQVYSRC